MIHTTINAYIEKGLLDDAHFAMLSAQSLLARNPVGKSYLTAYLQKKQVSREIAVQTVDLLLKRERRNRSGGAIASAAVADVQSV